ncbi:uncharacterized protein LOC131636316 [Vicia villosa]|uniref:uncharacterized protein LOC131636316 n=1 Tax=Vicia villosa TaxID=3911 RepID=UPI00273CBBB0|nr:uncharacterized protein LOC131636316 [Vicia villosa]
MASLTPGVLSKLLQNAGNRVTSEHRQPLLQVTEIIPRLSEDTWQPNTGYFLKLSDSLHSAYVSVSDSDAELIRSDKLQLGQFVYVTRFDSDESSSPVPLVRGLNPLPKRRPCVGNPTDLVSSEFLSFLNTSKPNNNVKKKKMNKGSVSGSVQRSQYSNGNKKNNVVVEMRRLSLDSATRRVWDHTKTKPSSPSSSSRFKSNKSTSTSPNVIDKKVSVKTDSSSPLKKSLTSVASPLKNKNENLCPKTPGTTPPRKSAAAVPKLACTGNGTVPSQLVKVPLNFKTWYDKSGSWDNLPQPISNLGKQVVNHRNVAFLAAVRSLEEASAADTVLQCMSLFSELCESRQTLSAGLLVKQFLELHLSLQRAKLAFDSLLSIPPETKPSSQITLQSLVEDACKDPTRKNATFWIQAALDTNLSKFNLYKIQEKTEALNGESCHYVVIENDNSCTEMNTKESSVLNKKSRITQANPLQNSTGKRLSSSKRNLLVEKNKDIEKQEQSKECELKVAASLAEKLLVASREWFLKYLEESISNEFGLKNEGSSQVACLLGQLREVNHWLDNLDSKDKVDHKVEKLRTSLYRFLLEHVNSAVASS